MQAPGPAEGAPDGAPAPSSWSHSQPPGSALAQSPGGQQQAVASVTAQATGPRQAREHPGLGLLSGLAGLPVLRGSFSELTVEGLGARPCHRWGPFYLCGQRQATRAQSRLGRQRQSWHASPRGPGVPSETVRAARRSTVQLRSQSSPAVSTLCPTRALRPGRVREAEEGSRPDAKIQLHPRHAVLSLPGPRRHERQRARRRDLTPPRGGLCRELPT